MAQMQIRGSTQILDSSIPFAKLDAALQAKIGAGVDFKASVRVASTANLTLSGTQTIDGVAVSAGERVLVKNQSTASQNGIYVVAAGAWSRATDADDAADVTAGLTVWVSEGSTQADTQWLLITDDPITVGSTSLSFTQVSGLGQILAGNGLTKTGNTIDVVAGNGISVAADSVSVNLASDYGLFFSGTGLAVKTATNAGLTIDANGLAINLGASSGLQLVTNGLGIKLDSTPALSLGAGGLKVLLDSNPGLQVTSGLKVIAGNNIVVDGTGVRTTTTPTFNSVTIDGGGGSNTVLDGDGAGNLTLTEGGFTHTFLIDANTASRNYTFPNKTGTVALVEDSVYEEVPTGSVNGSNVVFTLANTPVANTAVKVYLNGVRQKYTTHFTVSGTTITMNEAPSTGDLIIAEYRK